MGHDFDLERAARTMALLPGGAVSSMRLIPRCDDELFRGAAMRVASRFGVRVRLEHEGEWTVATFFRGDRPPD